MSNAVVYFQPDQDHGPGADEITMKAIVVYSGADIPAGPINGDGGNGGVRVGPINLNTVTNAIFSNFVEDAVIAEAGRLSLPAPARTRIFFPSYTRGT